MFSKIPPHDTYVRLLQTCLQNRDLAVGRSIHAQIVKSGLLLGVFLSNNLINFYGKNGFLCDAHQVFNEMPLRNSSSWNIMLSAYGKQDRMDIACQLFEEMPERDSVSWTVMIVGYNKMGMFEKSIRMFLKMTCDGISPSQFTFTNVISSCTSSGSLDLGKKVHAFVIKLGLSSYIVIANALINMYAKLGDTSTAHILFNRMNLRSLSSWNSMISLYTFSGRLDLAKAQFEEMEDRDVITWNSIIAGYNQRGYDHEAVVFFSRMLKESTIKPDNFTLASVLSACANLEILKSGKEIHAHIIRTETLFDESVRNALISVYAMSGAVEIAQKIIDRTKASNLSVISLTSLLVGYTKIGDLQHAREVFDLMNPDVVAWTALIVGYVQNGFYSEAIDIFRLMLIKGPKPNHYTLAAILSVCSSLTALDHGKQIHAKAIRSGQGETVSVQNALITMYAKAGSISMARRVFEQIYWSRDPVSWSSMILALAQHGYGEESIKLFEKMLDLRIEPDHITYIGVLSACTHVGLVTQGRKYFDLMQFKHQLTPTLSHYACMVDLFGRSGLLQQAQEFIEKMPIKPDTLAWGTLLAACKVHKDPNMAKIAADKLLAIDPNNSGAYSSLANVFSSCGWWEEAAKVWKMMKDRGVKKEKGLSWIQINNKVHVFGVSDGLHPQREAIYQTIAKLWDEIKKIGYIPDIDSVLHDIDNELKEQLLSHHSEKLAIACGLINTREKMTLRIMKNLRVCNDCHNAIKYITKAVGREIIVRDATRFHHFKNGSCSCKDYW